MTTFILILAALTTALAAGLFYAYSCSVVPGLGRLDDMNYLSAMQSINRAILNPVFFFSFMGAVILLPLSAVMHYGTDRFWLLVIASAFYIIGVFGVTAGGNVPLNNMIEAANLQSMGIEQLAQLRNAFEAKWNTLNLVRTVANIISLVFIILALLAKVNK